MARILIIEDDPTVAETIRHSLESERHSVEHSMDGKEASSRLKHYVYDLVILDWQLPGISGVEVCRDYRLSGGLTPVLMLTAKSTIDDKEFGLNAGADDYLTKPFHYRELLARVAALLRRPASFLGNSVTVRYVKVDFSAHRVFCNNVEVELRPKEFAILEFLIRNRNQVFSAERLLERLWTDREEADPVNVRTQVNRLRKKIDVEGEEPLIRGVFGSGYILED